MSSFTTKISATVAAAGLLASLGAGTAAAQSTAETQQAVQPNVGSLQVAGALPDWDVTNGAAQAAARDAIALAVSVNGGQAAVDAAGSSGPAVVAVGEGAVAEGTGVAPGLALATASADSRVAIPGDAPAECAGPFAFAGDFQTLTGCVSVNGMQTPLGGSVAAPWGLAN